MYVMLAKHLEKSFNRHKVSSSYGRGPFLSHQRTTVTSGVQDRSLQEFMTEFKSSEVQEDSVKKNLQSLNTDNSERCVNR